MEFAFPWPMSDGEWLAWSAAAATVAFGLLALFAPRITLRLLRLTTPERHPDAVGSARATIAGFHIGLGLSAILLAQPLLYMALGASWGFTAFGRIVSMLSDRGGFLHALSWLVLEAVLAAAPLAYALGFVP